MSEDKRKTAAPGAEAIETPAPAPEAGGLPPAVEEFRKNGGKGLILRDPLGDDRSYYFRTPTKADLSQYIMASGLDSKPRAAMEMFTLGCTIHPDREELKELFRENPALATNFQNAFMKSLGGGRLYSWEEIKEASDPGLPEPVQKALQEGKRIIGVKDFETEEAFYFRRPTAKNQEFFLVMAQLRQKPLTAMERLCRDCAVAPDGRDLVKRFDNEPALAMELHEQLNKSIGGGRGFDAQDF